MADKPRSRPGEKAAPHELSARATSTTASISCLTAWRERHAWARAILWLHDNGLPAAAPAGLAGWLRAHGADADWYHRGSCSYACASGDCRVVAFGGERPPEARTPRRDRAMSRRGGTVRLRQEPAATRERSG